MVDLSQAKAISNAKNNRPNSFANFQPLQSGASAFVADTKQKRAKELAKQQAILDRQVVPQQTNLSVNNQAIVPAQQPDLPIKGLGNTTNPQVVVHKPNNNKNSRYIGLSDKSKAFYDGFNSYMQKNYNIAVNIGSGARTQQEQNKLYNQGRTTPGNIVTWTRNSHHIGGNAMDLVGPKWYGDPKSNTLIANQMRVFAKANPTYGASFLPMRKDPNHVQFN